MVLRKSTTRHFWRTLYGAETKKITLLKRGDDQKQGTVRAVVLFGCRRSAILKSGETIQMDIDVGIRATWHIPRTELERTGVEYLNALDRIVEDLSDDRRPLPFARYWQPESPQTLEIKLFENVVNLDCVRVDPPRSA